MHDDFHESSTLQRIMAEDRARNARILEESSLSWSNPISKTPLSTKQLLARKISITAAPLAEVVVLPHSVSSDSPHIEAA